ncbi:Crp/Fnr family transcriptional regulator [Streptomyces sp. NPDC001100]
MAGTRLPDDSGLDDQVPFLARLETKDEAALLEQGHTLEFAARETLVRQYEPSTLVYFILSGWCKVSAASGDGYVALLALRGPGDVVGESAAVTGRPRSATVTALGPVSAMAVRGEHFTEFLDCHPAATAALLALLADRARASDRRRLEFASMPARQRLAVLLLDLARVHGRVTPKGIELDVPLTKEELAGSVGVSRRMIQRLLQELRAYEAVVTGHRALLITRPDILLRLAHPAP